MSGEIADLARTLDAATPDAALALLGEPSQRGRHQWRWGQRGSLSLEIAGPKRGMWCDHEAGEGGDMLALAQRQHHGDMRTAIDWARRFLRLPQETERRPAGTTRRAAEDERRPAPENASGERWSLEKARSAWREATSPAGTPVETYLAYRGLQLEAAAPLRFHPLMWRNVEYGPHGPAMLALMTCPLTARPVGVHVTYLRPEGRGKAHGPRPKVMLGAAGIIRLVPDAEVTSGLGLTEGAETGFAVMQRAGWRPVVAAGSAGAMRTFPVLPGIESLTLFADADDRGAGFAAAEACAERWAASGREARIFPARAGTDWHDCLTGTAA